MYNGFKSYRHFLNAKLHALSCVICGDDTVLDGELERMGKVSVKDLTETEAKALYKDFCVIAKKTALNIDKVKSIIGQNRASKNQQKAIIKIAKYNLHWGDDAIISYILDTIPDLRKRMLSFEIEHNKVWRFLGALNVKQADRLIKRLDQIKKRNGARR